METTKKRTLKKIGITLIIFIFISIIFFSIPITISHSKIEREHYYQTTEEWVENHDYVFIAKINRKVKTQKSKESNIPKSFYSMEQIAFIKGEKLSDKSQICFYGGSVFLNFINVVDGNDDFLKPKKYYLFVVNTQSEDSINFTLISNKQKVLLKGYDDKKSYTNQKKEIQQLIDQYINIVSN